MKVAGSSLLYSRHDLETACTRLADLGFERVDLGVIEGWGHLAPSDVVGEVAATADRVEVACRTVSLDPVAFNVGLDAADDAERRARIRAVAGVADGLDVEVLTLPAGPDDGRLEDDLDRFRTLVDATEGYDVSLTVETHWRTQTADPAVARRYPEAVDGLGLTLDPSHYAVGPFWPVAYDALAPYVDHVHIRQSGGDWDAIQRSVGEGLVDVVDLLSTLRAAGYDGVLTVEYIDALKDVVPDDAEARAEEMLAVLREHV